MKKTYIFDIDGTIADTPKGAKYNLAVPDIKRKYNYIRNWTRFNYKYKLYTINKKTIKTMGSKIS